MTPHGFSEYDPEIDRGDPANLSQGAVVKTTSDRLI
jgi:hypothetical protein